jgi:hypothetical protein
MRRAAQSSSVVYRTTVVVTISQIGFPGVQSYTHPQGSGCVPRFGIDGLLYVRSGGDSIGSEGEDSEAAVPLPTRFHYVTVVPADNLLNEVIMTNEGRTHLLRELFPQLGAAFNIGEQEGDSAGGQIGHRLGLHPTQAGIGLKGVDI